MSSDYARRRRIILLMKRKEELDLRELLQTLSERRVELRELQTRCEGARLEYQEASSSSRSRLAAGATLDLSIQRVTTRSLVVLCRQLDESQRGVDRMNDAVDQLQQEVNNRRARIRKLELAEEQAGVEIKRVVANVIAGEQDAIWLSMRRGASAK